MAYAGEQEHALTCQWIVDPQGEEVRVYHLRENPDLPKVILRLGDALRTWLLPGFGISVKKIFQHF
jgi:Uma2 family endonuclease